MLKRFLRKVEATGELMLFLWERRLWWMIPMVLVLVVFGLFIVLTQPTILAPFIYVLF